MPDAIVTALADALRSREEVAVTQGFPKLTVYVGHGGGLDEGRS